MADGNPQIVMNPLLPAAAMMAASVSARSREGGENSGAMSMRGIMRPIGTARRVPVKNQKLDHAVRKCDGAPPVRSAHASPEKRSIVAIPADWHAPVESPWEGQ